MPPAVMPWLPLAAPAEAIISKLPSLVRGHIAEASPATFATKISDTPRSTL
jgi:hypothetical protein